MSVRICCPDDTAAIASIDRIEQPESGDLVVRVTRKCGHAGIVRDPKDTLRLIIAWTNYQRALGEVFAERA